MALTAVAAGVVMVVAGLTGYPLPPGLWAGIFAIYFLGSFRALKRSGIIVLLVSVGLFLSAWIFKDKFHNEGLVSAGFFFVYLMIMQHMADLAARSPKIAEAAELIVARPPGQRYLFVTFGTHVFSLFLNIGAVILITSLLTSRLEGGGESTRRSLSMASLRGFAAMSMWSPSALCMLIIFTHVTGATYADYVPFGLASAVIFLLSGYFLERSRRSSVVDTTPLSWKDAQVLFRVVGLALILVVGGLTWVSVFNVRLIEAMFSVVFILGAIWTLLFIRAGHTSVRLLAEDYTRATANLANEVAIISGASVVGAVASGYIGEWMGLQGVLSYSTATVVAVLTPTVVFGAGMLAINPVVTVTVLASSLNPVWPDQAKLLLALAMAWGWGAAAGGTPFTANVLIVSQKFGRDAFTVALRWNRRLILSMLAVTTLLSGAGMYIFAG